MFGGLNKMFNKGSESAPGSFGHQNNEKKPIDYTENYDLIECKAKNGEIFRTKVYVDPKTFEDIVEVEPQKYRQDYFNKEYTFISKSTHSLMDKNNEDIH